MTTGAGPVQPEQRSAAPDAARGLALLPHALTGLALTLFLLRRDRTLLVRAAGLLVVVLVVDGTLAALSGTVGSAAGTDGGDAGLDLLDPSTVLGALVLRVLALLGYLLGSPVLVASLLPPVLVGVWAARRQVLERPGEHRRLLRRTAVVGLAVSVVGGAPFALVVGRVWDLPAVVVGIAGGVHAVTGVLGGAAFVALVTVALAVGLRAAGRSGPAEVLLRRLMCGSRAQCTTPDREAVHV